MKINNAIFDLTSTFSKPPSWKFLIQVEFFIFGFILFHKVFLDLIKIDQLLHLVLLWLVQSELFWIKLKPWKRFLFSTLKLSSLVPITLEHSQFLQCFFWNPLHSNFNLIILSEFLKLLSCFLSDSHISFHSAWSV